MIDSGGDIDLKDNGGVTVRMMVTEPGPIPPHEALLLLGIKQRDIKVIERRIHPELIKYDDGVIVGHDYGSHWGSGKWCSVV